MSRWPRGICTGCGKSRALMKDGTVFPHHARRSPPGGPYTFERCEGNRKPPRSEQPEPAPNSSTPIVELVTADLRRRMEKGIKTYGTPLQAHNGRDALKDAYEECLDMACYLRQAIEERNG